MTVTHWLSRMTHWWMPPNGCRHASSCDETTRNIPTSGASRHGDDHAVVHPRDLRGAIMMLRKPAANTPRRPDIESAAQIQRNVAFPRRSTLPNSIDTQRPLASDSRTLGLPRIIPRNRGHPRILPPPSSAVKMHERDIDVPDTAIIPVFGMRGSHHFMPPASIVARVWSDDNP